MACASISQSSGLPAPEAGARPTPLALPPTLGHVWVWLCEAGGKKKRKSPHHTYSQLLRSARQPIFLSNHCSKKNGMPSDPSMTDNSGCRKVHCILMDITLMVLSPVSPNYKPAGDLSGTHWESWPPLSGPSCLEPQLQTAELKGHSDIQMLLSDSKHPEARTHRSQRNACECHQRVALFGKVLIYC